MIKKTHPFRTVLFATLMCGVSTTALFAQGPGGGPPPGGGPGQHHGPPPSPLFDALDTNHDGVISADEMTSAPASLKAMLKTGETALTREDVRPAHPPQGQPKAAPGA